ncbi:unnamed protein product [Calicophoron daubneyi]|uniref:Menin n=1 Tax=Calicophoron daubneyi TaxID=300641 RepID=A0AAV2TM06_CALDB
MTLRSGQSSGTVRTWRRHFPLNSIDGVLDLIREIIITSGLHVSSKCTTMKMLRDGRILELNELDPSNDFIDVIHPSKSLDVSSCLVEPNLAFVSIVLGFIENNLTSPCGHIESTSSRAKCSTTATNCASQSKLSPSCPSPNTRGSSVAGKVIVPPSPLSIHVEIPEEDTSVSDLSEQPDGGNRYVMNSPSETSSPASAVTTSEGKPTCAVDTPHRRFSTRRHKVRSHPHRRHASLSNSAISTISMVSMHPTVKHQMLPISTTNPCPTSKQRRFSDSTLPNTCFPCLTFDEADRLYQSFHGLIMNNPKLQPFIKTASGSNGSDSTAHNNSTVNGATDPPRWATRTLIRIVCEVLWSRMGVGRSKEKLTHTQNVYSFLTVGLLDSFGLAYTTVAACQLLGYSDVHLALSEDHGWVEFGPPEKRESADVASWIQMSQTSAHEVEGTSSHSSSKTASTDDHLSDAELNAALPAVRIPPLERSWLYVNGYPVICRPCILAIAAAVTAIQPGASTVIAPAAPVSAPPESSVKSPPSDGDLISPSGLARHLSSSSTISLQLVTLKHRLLWILYDANCLARYPLGLTNLADLEDAFPTSSRLSSFLDVSQVGDKQSSLEPELANSLLDPENNLPSVPETASLALALYNQAVDVTRLYYANQHIYPYTCLAGCLYRHGDNRGALKYWSEATRVIGQYNHSSEDWEIYRELLEIATILMPQMFRGAAETARSCCEGSVDTDSDGCLYQPTNILDDPQCLAHLLSFYDNLCLWEEGSPVPVLHVGWVDKLMVSLARFSQRARRHLCLSVASAEEREDVKKNVQLVSNSSNAVTATTVDGSITLASSAKRARIRTRSESSSRTDTTQKSEENSSMKPLTNDKPVKKEPKLKVKQTTSPPVSMQESSNVSVITKCADVAELHAGDLKSTESSCRLSKCSGRKISTSPFHAGDLLLSHTNDSVFADLTPTSIVIQTSSSSDVQMTETLDQICREADQKTVPLDELEEQDNSPSPPPVAEFPNHEDLFDSIVEACGYRLLNPAFLCGVELTTPFLLPNTAPEDVFAVLDAKQPLSALTVPVQHGGQSLFLTPPDSGGMYDHPLENSAQGKVTTAVTKSDPCSPHKNTSFLPPAISFEGTIDKPESALKSEVSSPRVGSLSEPSELSFFPINTSEELTLLDDMSHDLIDSVADLVNSAPVSEQPERKPLGSSEDIFDLLLNAESNNPQFGNSGSQGCESDLNAHKPESLKDLTVHLTLRSVKMISIVELLRASRLNSSAIKLALTAQSQVCLRRTGGVSSTYGV